MLRRTTVVAVLGMVLASVEAGAQATGTPSFNAPYRAFGRHEFGAALSFVNFDAATAIEGMFRFASGEFDVGLRGGFSFDGVDVFLAGAEARYRAITHSVNFPLDGALIFGAGLAIDGGTTINLPLGLSLGRRLNVERSQVSIVPYVQPTLLISNFDAGLTRDTEIFFGFGVGGDFRLSRAFDARLSFGFGDLEGISIAAVWLR